MESWEIKGGTLEYFDEEHVYLYNGMILPSVTQILSKRYPNEFAYVSKSVLRNAGERGTAVHKAIENYCKFDVDSGTKEVRDFKFIQRIYDFEVLDNELPLVIFKDEEPIACGRLDMTISMKNGVGIADIKTNSTLNKEKIALQLNMYRIGLKQSYGVDAKFLKVIHLREGLRKLVDIPIAEDLAWETINEYLERRNNE